MNAEIIVPIIVGYFLGSVPFGFLLTRLAGAEDVRRIGSGSIGATNVLRTGRKGLAAATLALDMVKGAVAVLLGRLLAGEAHPAETGALAAGLATLLAVTLAQVHGGTLPLIRALALLTVEPARLLGCDAGTLRKGAPADLCLFNPDRAWHVESGALPGKAQNTPFDGRGLEGRVLATWKAGRRVFAE